MQILNQLIHQSDLIEIIGNYDLKIENLHYDSRKCNANSMFFALRGEVADGHNFIDKAIEKGASAIVCEELPANYANYKDTTFIKVNNARKAMSYSAQAFYDFPSKNMKIIGITGTNGKTSITFILKSIIEATGKKAGVIGTTGIYFDSYKIETNHTTPESIELAYYISLMRDNDVEFIAMEVSSHSLEQFRADNINFASAIFTNLTHDHLDYHHNMDAYCDAKKKLFDMLDASSFAILNADDIYSESVSKDCKAKKLLVGRSESSKFIIDFESTDLSHSSFTIRNGISIDLKTKLIGKFNIDNCALAAVSALSLGIALPHIIEGIAQTDGAKGRMQRLILKNEAVAIVDYAHTPDALEKALNACRYILDNSGNNKSRIICVFGCGGDRDKSKRPEMGKIASERANYVIITNDNPRTENPLQIIKDIQKGISKEQIHLSQAIPNRAEAIAKAYKISLPNDIILIAGKGHENYQIIGTEKQHFDDYKEINQYSGN